MKKILLIVVVYYGIIAISACCKCPLETNKNFIYSELETGIYSCSLSDSTFQYEAFQTDSIPTNNLSIKLSLEGTIVHAGSIRSMLSFPINAAHACKCQETTFSTSDTIGSIVILTLNEFDSAHISGSDVTEYFKILDYEYLDSKAKVVQKPIASYFQHSYTNHSPGLYLNIYLSQPPQNKGYVQFQIKITCKNGKEFEAETKRVYLY